MACKGFSEAASRPDGPRLLTGGTQALCSSARIGSRLSGRDTRSAMLVAQCSEQFLTPQSAETAAMASTMMSAASSCVLPSRQSVFSGRALRSKAPVPRRALSLSRAVAEEKKKEKAPWKPPTLDPNTPSPIFGGSTGGLLRKAQV